VSGQQSDVGDTVTHGAGPDDRHVPWLLCGHRGAPIRSITTEIPCPTPMHMVARP
jgi:hypothetical protein